MEIKPPKIRGRLKAGKASVKCLMPHPMETGVRKDLDGNPIPAHYITTVTVTHNDQVFLTADWGPSVSKDPYFGFEVSNAQAGDVIAISWKDNLGNTSSGELTLKGK